jgi:hypothetical protein
MQVRKQMRHAYNTRQQKLHKKTAGLSQAKKFSREKIGQQMKELLNATNS